MGTEGRYLSGKERRRGHESEPREGPWKAHPGRLWGGTGALNEGCPDSSEGGREARSRAATDYSSPIRKHLVSSNSSC